MKTDRNYYFFERLKKKHIPLHVQIELTTRCNNDCIHCIRGKAAGNELTTSEMKKIISQLKNAGCMQLTITGGEPLLRSDFFEVSDFARSEGFVLRLFSNATLIDAKAAREFKKLRFKEIRITIFSMKEKTHDLITRNPGSLRKTLNAIKLLKKNGVPFRISAVIMKQNMSDIKALKERAIEEKWNFSCDTTIYPTYGGEKGPLCNRVADEDIKYLNEEGMLNFGGYKDIISKKNELDNFYLGNLHCYISSNGRVFPHATVRLELGSIRKRPFYDIWRESRKLQWLRNLDIGDFECSPCKYFLRCGWNPGLALSEHGALTAKVREYCRIESIKMGGD